MPSLKSQLYSWYFWLNSKGSFQSAESLRRRIQVRRKTQDHRPPTWLRRQLMIEEREVEAVVVEVKSSSSNSNSDSNICAEDEGASKHVRYTVYEVAPKSELPTQAHILYLHGGVFVYEMTSHHWELVATLAERLQAVVTVPIYPLGPEHGLMEVYEAMQQLHDEVCLPARDDTPLWIVGDSAGATMAVALTQRALEACGPVASRLVLISPMVSCVFGDDETREAARRDPWMDIPGLEEVARLVAPDIPPEDPRLSVINGALDELPPMMVYAASEDLLTPETRRFVGLARDKARQVEMVEGDGMMHDWPLMPIPEADEAVDLLVYWLERAKRSRFV